MKKIVGILLVLVTMSVILYGCGLKPEEETGNSNNSSTTTDTNQTESDENAEDSESATEEIVEINFWNFPNYAVVDDVPGKYEEMLIEAFEAKNPNIKVNVEMIDFQSGPEKINTSIAAGTSPDVLYDAPGRIISWGKDGILAPLNDIITDDVKSNVSGSILDASSYEGNVYMYPTHHAPFMMAFNRDMLEELGLMDMINFEGDRSWTVDEFEAFLRALKDNGQRGPIIFASSQGGDQGTRAFLANLYDSPITNDALTEYTINSENGVKSLEWVINAVDEGLLENGSAYDANAAIDEFVSGRVAGTLLWSPGLEKTKLESLEFDTVFLPYPNSENPKLEFLVGGLCIIDNRDEKKIEAAKKFIDFIANDPEWAPKNIESTGSFPVDQRINVDYGTEAMDYNASMSQNYGTYYNTIPGFVEMRTFWFPMLQATINHAETAEDALNDFVEKSNATIK